MCLLYDITHALWAARLYTRRRVATFLGRHRRRSLCKAQARYHLLNNLAALGGHVIGGGTDHWVNKAQAQAQAQDQVKTMVLHTNHS